MNELTVTEQTQLDYYEEIIERGKLVFFQVGMALMTIRDERLYRGTHTTFERYCQERWGFSRRYANMLVDASDVVNNILPEDGEMSTIVDKPQAARPEWTTAGLEDLGTIVPKNTANLGTMVPKNEAQARPLAKLPPEQQREAWQKVVETARDTLITARHVQQVVDDILHPQPEPEYFYRNQPVKLLEMSYVAHGQQYCTIEIVNLYGKKQRQTVQFRHLTTKNSQEKAETGAYDYVQADFDFEALPPEAQVRRVENGALLLFWEWLDEQLPKSEMRTLAGRSRLIQANGKLAGILDGFYEFVERSNENENE